ncbi:MAG: hypothetical protein AABX10_01610 [Nanoarchaeota archaeon]
MKELVIVFVLCLFFVSALEIPHTVEIITARGSAVFPISFFNSGTAGTYTAQLEETSPALRLDSRVINLGSEEFGSFNLIVGNDEIARGIYFDNLIISRGSEIVQEIPIVIGLESRSSEIEYDVSIDFDANSDISIISGETVLSPLVNVYKLNYNNPGSNGVALTFSVYSLDGDLIISTSETVSVSRQASFEHFFNLGLTEYEEVIMVVSAQKEDSFGVDLSQVSLSSSLLFSPPVGSRTPRLYFGIFIFLISSIAIISYLWYNKYNGQAKNWKAELQYVKKTQFSDAAKGLRKIEAQKSVLDRAYSSRYISKDSYDAAINEINKLSDRLKKRL